jgi:hypothetical protein
MSDSYSGNILFPRISSVYLKSHILDKIIETIIFILDRKFQICLYKAQLSQH